MTLGHSHTAAAVALAAYLMNASIALAADIQFAAEPSYSSEAFGLYDPSEDKKAFQVVFTSLGIGEDGKPLATPVVTRTFSMVVPFTGGDSETEMAFNIGGSSLITPGTHGTLIITVNGHSTTINVEADEKDPEKPYVKTFAIRPGTAKEARITVLLALYRDASTPDGSAYLKLSSVGTDTRKMK